MDQRQILRQTLRQQRRDLPLATRQQAAEAAAEHLINHPLFIQSQRIAFYCAVDHELNPAPLLQHAEKVGKSVYLPVLHPLGFPQLYFMRFHSTETLIPNRLRIPEPLFIAKYACFPWLLDLVIVPLLGFDREGHRLGMGAGFYDRSFAFLHQLTPHHPQLLGYAYACQQVAIIPSQPWDVPLDGVVTEEKMWLFEENGLC